jgi:hypothetical protein
VQPSDQGAHRHRPRMCRSCAPRRHC